VCSKTHKFVVVSFSMFLMQVSLLQIVWCVFSFCVLGLDFFKFTCESFFESSKSLSLLLIVLNLICIFFCFMFCVGFCCDDHCGGVVLFHLCCLYYALGT
jgi:hypothetical protein